MDNTVVYKTPTFGGFTVYAQYSSDMNTKVAGTENKGDSNRYYALGATFMPVLSSSSALLIPTTGIPAMARWNSSMTV